MLNVRAKCSASRSVLGALEGMEAPAPKKRTVFSGVISAASWLISIVIDRACWKKLSAFFPFFSHQKYISLKIKRKLVEAVGIDLRCPSVAALAKSQSTLGGLVCKLNSSI